MDCGCLSAKRQLKPSIAITGRRRCGSGGRARLPSNASHRVGGFRHARTARSTTKLERVPPRVTPRLTQNPRVRNDSAFREQKEEEVERVHMLHWSHLLIWKCSWIKNEKKKANRAFWRTFGRKLHQKIHRKQNAKQKKRSLFHPKSLCPTFRFWSFSFLQTGLLDKLTLWLLDCVTNELFQA